MKIKNESFSLFSADIKGWISVDKELEELKAALFAQVQKATSQSRKSLDSS